MNGLTTSDVLKRSRAKSLQQVRSLNCWGCDLAEVSVLHQLPNLEVLNLSCNNLATLRDLSSCRHLRELYIRKNQISEFVELDHLAGLPRLEVLWLAENPLTSLPGYRARVLATLPHIRKLDNTVVGEEERLWAGRSEDTSPSNSKGAILTAVLCLLPELDQAGLREVRSRLAQILED